MDRLTRRDKVDGNEFVRINKGAPDFIVYEKLAEYEDLGLEPSEIKPYIELAEKMTVCDLIRENKRLSDKIRFLEAQK